METTVIDTEAQATSVTRLVEYCKAAEEQALISAYKKLFVVQK